MLQKFTKWIKKQDKSIHTKGSYLFAVRKFLEHCDGKVTRKSVQKFKKWLMDNYAPQTVNARLAGVNCYLTYIKRPQWKAKIVKLQQKTYLDNVISNGDLKYLNSVLYQKEDKFCYFIIRFLSTTGVRISEFKFLKVEHVKMGHLDVYGKGNKYRRIYITSKLRKEFLEWFDQIGLKSGYVFKKQRRDKKPITNNQLRKLLFKIADEYGIDKDVMHVHSFRHRFAKNFIERHKDISLLADILGHSSIETTRIYTRKTSTEQKELMDKIVTW